MGGKRKSLVSPARITCDKNVQCNVMWKKCIDQCLEVYKNKAVEICGPSEIYDAELGICESCDLACGLNSGGSVYSKTQCIFVCGFATNMMLGRTTTTTAAQEEHQRLWSLMVIPFALVAIWFVLIFISEHYKTKLYKKNSARLHTFAELIDGIYIDHREIDFQEPVECQDDIAYLNQMSAQSQEAQVLVKAEVCVENVKNHAIKVTDKIPDVDKNECQVECNVRNKAIREAVTMEHSELDSPRIAGHETSYQQNNFELNYSILESHCGSHDRPIEYDIHECIPLREQNLCQSLDSILEYRIRDNALELTGTIDDTIPKTFPDCFDSSEMNVTLQSTPLTRGKSSRALTRIETNLHRDSCIFIPSADRSKSLSSCLSSEPSEYDFVSTGPEVPPPELDITKQREDRFRHVNSETAVEIKHLPQDTPAIDNLEETFEKLVPFSWIKGMVSNGKFIRIKVDGLDMINAVNFVQQITHLNQNQFECVHAR